MWDVPTSGPTVDHYVVEVHKDTNIKTFKTSETYLNARFTYDIKYFVRVAGANSAGIYGPFSENSAIMFVIKP